MKSIEGINRRMLLKLVAGAGAVLGLNGNSKIKAQSTENAATGYRKSLIGYAAPPIDKVRIIVIGVGRRGKTSIARLVRIAGVEIVAVVDIRESETKWADTVIRRYLPQQKPPVLYHGSEDDFQKAYELDFDLAYICTPWNWHVPMAIAAMEAGAHTAVEVPIATTLEDCWKLVHVAEQKQRHCMMLENVCYGEAEMAVLNMCRAGVFGNLVHGEAAYIHDLRDDLYGKKNHFPSRWRLQQHKVRNGNLYPTHGLGPVSKYMDLNGSDRALSLVSMSSIAMGIQDLAIRNYGLTGKDSELGIKQGDINTTMIRTQLGRTIMVQFSTGSPRPYTRHNLIQGTKGIFAGFPDRIALDPNPHSWNEDLCKKYLDEFSDPSWKKMDKLARKMGGHGGMDTVMDRKLIQNLRTGSPMDISVYDSVLWSSIAPLSEISVANGSAPVSIPDFVPGTTKNDMPK